MRKIETPKGKLYGTLDERTYILTIIDGKNTRKIQIPPREGCRLWYTAKDATTETIDIPPQQQLLKRAM